MRPVKSPSRRQTSDGEEIRSGCESAARCHNHTRTFGFTRLYEPSIVFTVSAGQVDQLSNLPASIGAAPPQGRTRTKIFAGNEKTLTDEAEQASPRGRTLPSALDSRLVPIDYQNYQGQAQRLSHIEADPCPFQFPLLSRRTSQLLSSHSDRISRYKRGNI